jgi:hypothetical protein
MVKKTYGWQDLQGINENYFATIYPSVPTNPLSGKVADFELPDDLKNIQVRGKIISDDNSLDINWESPLEGSNAESNFSFTSALAQSGIMESAIGSSVLLGRTSVSAMETVQVFKGIEPQTINLTLEFVAYKNAFEEVEAPLSALLKMASPQLTNGIVNSAITQVIGAIKNNDSISIDKAFGYVPFDVIVKLGKKRYNSNTYVIANVNSSRDDLKLDKDGNSIIRQISLTLKSKKSLSRNDINIKTL